MAWTRALSWSPQIQTLVGLTRRTGSNDPTFSTTQANTNTHSARFTTTAEAQGYAFGSSKTDFRAAYWMYITAAPSSTNRALIGYIQQTGGTGDISIVWDKGVNLLAIRISGSNVATASLPTALTDLNIWTNIGIVYKAGTSTGRVSIYVSGALILTYTGNVGTGATAVFGPGVNGSDTWGGDVFWDDFYVDFGSGESDSAPPTRKFLFALPGGAGTDTAWTPNTGTNWQAVDETTLDSDTTYVQAATSGLRDNYAFADVTLPSGYSISQVIVGAIAKKTASIDAKLILETLRGGSYGSSSALVLTTSYAYYEAQFPTDPNTAAAWTLTNANAGQYGYKSDGTFV